MALGLWKQNPGAFAGLVLDAAYPVGGRDAEGHFQAMALPKDDAVKKVPLLVFVGEKDGGAALWKKIQSDWEQAGVPLTLNIVAGKGHDWLLGAPQVAELERWLKALVDRQAD